MNHITKHLIAPMLMLLLLSPVALYAAKSEEELDLMEQRRIDLLVNNLGINNDIPVELSMFKFESMEEEAIPHLSRILRDEDMSFKTKVNAIHTIGRIGKKAKRAVSTLIPFLRMEDNDIKAVTAIALGKIGRLSKEAIPYLASNMLSENKWVMRSSREALLKIGTIQALEEIKLFDMNAKEKSISTSK